MKRVFLITSIFASIFLCVTSTYGQQNIGEFNRIEGELQFNLNKEYVSMGSASSIGWAAEVVPVAELNQYIVKAKGILAKCEERLQKSKSAIKELQEIPANQIKRNDEYKSWTESLCNEYEALIRIIKANIEIAEKKLLNAKEKAKEENKLKEEELAKKVTSQKATDEAVGNKSSTSKTTTDDFWSNNGNQNTAGVNPRSSENSDTSDENFVSNSQFSNNLTGVKEGNYFKDDKGQHYLRTAHGARIVDKYTYEQAQADKITADFNVERSNVPVKYIPLLLQTIPWL